MVPTGSSVERQPALWWVPGVDEAVSGMYWISSDGTPCASWHSALPGGPRSLWSRENPIEVLHGEAMGKAITLVNVQLVSATHPSRGRMSQTEATARQAFEGDLLLMPEDMTFDRARVSARDLASWAEWKSWHDVDEDRLVCPKLEHLGKRRQEFPCEGGVLAVEDAGSWSQEHGEWILSDGCRIDLQLDDTVPLDDIGYFWLRPVQLLLSTASGRQSTVRTLFVSRKNRWLVPEDSDERDARRHSAWLRVRAPGVYVDSEDKPLSTLNLLHRLSDLTDQEQIARFVTSVHHHRYALERYEDAKSGSAGSRETAFTEAVQAVESLDSGLHVDVAEDWQEEAEAVVTEAFKVSGHTSTARRAALRGIRTAHHKSLSARLRRVDRETGGVIGAATSGRQWPDEIAAVRNAVTHGRTGPVFEEIGGALIIGREICLVLFELAWLRVMGYDAEVAESFLHRRAHQWSNMERISEHSATLGEAKETLRRSVGSTGDGPVMHP